MLNNCCSQLLDYGGESAEKISAMFPKLTTLECNREELLWHVIFYHLVMLLVCFLPPVGLHSEHHHIKRDFLFTSTNCTDTVVSVTCLSDLIHQCFM